MNQSSIGSCVRFAVLSVAMLTLLGCGGASTAIVAAIGGAGGGGGSSPPVVRSLTVTMSRTSPATMTFELSDVATVALEFRSPRTSQWVPMRLSGDTSLDQLAPSPVVHTKDWEFDDATQLGTAGFSRDIPIRVRIVGNGDTGTSSLTQGFGNDPSVIEQISVSPGPGGEVVGLANVELTVTDSSDDRVSLYVEYDLLDDAPDDGFQTATGLAVYPPVARQPSGFLWNVTTDLGFTEHDVLLRITTYDGTAYGTPVVIPFRVDNNLAPTVVIDTANFVLNPDERRGIPIPFTVFDGDENTGEPGDDVQLVFQWRRVEGSYPAVDFSNLGSLRQNLLDPGFRRAHQICTEIPRSFGGRVVPIGATHVRLPEVASSASSLVTRDPATQQPRVHGALDILRASDVPTPIASTWSHDPHLHEPVAVLPLGPGLCGFVLERLGTSWRIRAIVFSTGEEVTTVASGEGTPTAMAFDADRHFLLVAVQLDVAGHWQIRRVRLQRDGAGPGDELATADGSTELGPIRGITSVATQAALFTVGNSLIRADYPAGQAARVHALFGPAPLAPLRAPWGVVQDPLNANSVYVAEHDADRIVRIDVETRVRTPLVANGIGLPRPESIALEQLGGPRRRARLLVITGGNAIGESRELRGIDLGKSVASEVFRVFPNASGAAGYSGVVGNISLGRDGLRVIALTSASDIAVGGGLEQRRQLLSAPVDFDLARQIVAVAPPFDPPVAVSATWRVRVSSSVVLGSPRGTAGSFLWDSEDVVNGGAVFVRATPIDSEPGVASDTAPTGRAKSLRPAIDVAPTVLGDASTTHSPQSVIAADLDGDGDLDLACANFLGNDVTVFFQASPAVFDPVPQVLGDSSTTNRPQSVIAADLDGDGDMDLVCANFGSNDLAVFFQTSPGHFDPVPRIVGSRSTTYGPDSVIAADIDADGDLDLVCANASGDNLAVFFQTSPGNFDPVPRILGNSSTTSGPRSVIAADLDGDGDLDLACANAGFPGDNLAVFFQSIPGSFAPAPLILGDSSTTMGPYSVIAADVDGDGDLDLVSANSGGSDLTVFFQTSPGQFDSAPHRLGDESRTYGATSVVAADIDGDGDLDLVCANYYGDSLAAFIQTSPGQFDRVPRIIGDSSTTYGPLSVIAADLDGDGDLDFVCANNFGDNLAVF
ncbi:MAG: VCBS repeat-containing protein, partial [Planctomycetes bacterium]|nr:VCBS repeat-containing protein [Planctomycetota bacterium]